MEMFQQHYSLSSANFLTLVTTFLICFLMFLLRRRKLGNLPPGNLGLPFSGETIDFCRSFVTEGSLDRFITDRMRSYSSKVFKTSLMGEKMVVLGGLSGNKFVFSNEYKLMRVWFIGPMKKILLPDMKPEAVQEDLQRWRKHFYEFLKPFALQKYVETMDQMVKDHMSSDWEPNSDTIRRVHPLSRKLAFAISCRLFLGVEDQSLMERLRGEFDIVSSGLASIPIDLPGTNFRRSLKTGKLMRDEFESIIRKERRQLLADAAASSNNASRDPKFMANLIMATDRGKLLSESEIATMVVVALVAGHEPASALFTNLVYYLGHHPHVYTRALAEQLEIRSLKGSKEKVLTWEDTKKMTYSRQVVNEVLRLAPPSMGGFREAAHDFSYEGFTIPKGWKVFWSINSTHKDPEYFPNPENFDPARFEGDGPAPYTFTPFGGGPRICPGNEFSLQAALLFMHNLLINYKWENLIVNEKVVCPPCSFPPADAMPIKLQRRA